MNTEVKHNFSDSEDEHEDEHDAYDDDVTISVEEHKAKVAEHRSTIESLTQELVSVKLDHTNEIARVQESNQDQAALFKIERHAHTEEMAKRQQRIDFLMDRCISK